MARPAVDGLESRLRGKATVVRVNVFDDVGRAVAGRYGFNAVPTFVVFDSRGVATSRYTGYPDADKLERALLGSQ